MKYKTLKPAVTLLLLGLVNSTASAYEIKISSLYGVDSNPHQLTDSFNPVEDNFFYFDLRYRQKHEKKLTFTVDLKGASFSEDSNADWSKAKVDLTFKSKFGSKKDRVRYRIFGNYNKTDSTYVSKFTGVEASFGGVLLGDRYDADIFNIGTIFSFKTDSEIKLDFGLAHREKQYESYDVIGLSKLDYAHNSLRFDMKMPVTDISNFTLNTSYTVRDYDDRRAKDLAGADIASTELAFNLVDIKGTYSYKSGKNNTLKLAIKYGKRTDNEAGYWDSNSSYVSVYTKQELTDKHQISAKLKYSVFNYDNRTDAVGENLDEQSKENKGLSLDIDYLWLALSGQNTKLSTYVKLSVASFDSSTVEYEYQRNQVSFGVKWEFD
ncbi:MAG: hypothetical protein COA86_10780 [Kangiella sp.]|nr:MAG: hypothetical protein COA86_10780 [Kangiella sp.]